MSPSLPVLLSLPHGGLDVPEEVASRLAIDATTIYNECDLWVDDLFDFAHPDLTGGAQEDASGQSVLGRVTMPIARVLIDANRDLASLGHWDGAVKSRTSYGQAIYLTPLSVDEQAHLLDRYWHPFQDELEQLLVVHGQEVQLFLDCHNMAQVSPAAYTNPGAPRPFICLANLGDANGEARATDQPITCPPVLMRRARDWAEDIFGDLELLEPAGPRPAVAAINSPFAGGHIVRHAYRRLRELTGRDVPCIMIEVNRGLFVGNQSTTTPVQPMNQAAVAALRVRLYRWTQALLAEIATDQTSSATNGGP